MYLCVYSEYLNVFLHFPKLFELYCIAVCCDQGRRRHGCNVFIVKNLIILQNTIIIFEKVNHFILLTKYFSLSSIFFH